LPKTHLTRVTDAPYSVCANTFALFSPASDATVPKAHKTESMDRDTENFSLCLVSTKEIDTGARTLGMPGGFALLIPGPSE
jgi:hypothetical protein